MKLFSNFIKDKNVASITPSSKALIKQLLSHVDFNKARTIVEFGSGTGVITKALLEHMRQDAKLLAFETNQNLASQCQIEDKRLTIINESCENIKNHVQESVDYIISGVPFSMFSKELSENIIVNSKSLLPNGTMLVYQMKDQVRPYLERHFSSIQEERCLRNVPPLKIFIASKPLKSKALLGSKNL